MKKIKTSKSSLNCNAHTQTHTQTHTWCIIFKYNFMKWHLYLVLATTTGVPSKPYRTCHVKSKCYVKNTCCLLHLSNMLCISSPFLKVKRIRSWNYQKGTWGNRLNWYAISQEVAYTNKRSSDLYFSRE